MKNTVTIVEFNLDVNHQFSLWIYGRVWMSSFRNHSDFCDSFKNIKNLNYSQLLTVFSMWEMWNLWIFLNDRHSDSHSHKNNRHESVRLINDRQTQQTQTLKRSDLSRSDSGIIWPMNHTVNRTNSHEDTETRQSYLFTASTWRRREAPSVSNGDGVAASSRSGIFKRICKELYKLTQVCDYPLQRKACWDTQILENLFRFVPRSSPELPVHDPKMILCWTVSFHDQNKQSLMSHSDEAPLSRFTEKLQSLLVQRNCRSFCYRVSKSGPAGDSRHNGFYLQTRDSELNNDNKNHKI